MRKWWEQFRSTRKICVKCVSVDIKDIWETAVGQETLVCALEPNNSRDRNAAAIVAAGIPFVLTLTTVHMDLVEARQLFDPLA